MTATKTLTQHNDPLSRTLTLDTCPKESSMISSNPSSTDSDKSGRVARAGLPSRVDTPHEPSPPVSGLASPTTLTVQEYLNEKRTTLSVPPSATPRTPLRRQLFDDDGSPRPPPTMLSPSALVTSLAMVGIRSNTASPTPSGRWESGEVHIGDTEELGTIAQETRSLLMSEGSADPLPPSRRRSVSQSRILNPMSPALLGGVPFEYTHESLLKWGHHYLGSSATADVFVRAVSLKKTSDKPAITKPTSPDTPPSTPSSVSIHLRVQPKSDTRKPFLLHKKFNIAGGGAEQPRAVVNEKDQSHSTAANKKRRDKEKRRGIGLSPLGSPRTPLTASSLGLPSAGLGSPFEGRKWSEAEPIAVHIEYALHRLPLLAAIMLSGHVLKGDVIELALPFPHVWPAVVEWMYTGEWEGGSEKGQEMLEVITFLGGKVVD